MIKLLNLYAGIGGNVHLLDRNKYQIISIEHNIQIAKINQLLHPEDIIITCDGLCKEDEIRTECPGNAKYYLRLNYKKFDFIWGSPPCQTHSKMRFTQKSKDFYEYKYPNVDLYQIITLLQTHFEGTYIIENVKPYYESWIKPNFILNRHYYWSNKYLHCDKLQTPKPFDRMYKPDWIEFLDIPVKQKDIKLQWLRNCVHPKEGLQLMESNPSLNDFFD